jgi:hypothetical protein
VAIGARAGFLACAGLILAPAVWAMNTELGQLLPYVECGRGLRLSAIVSWLCILATCLSGRVSWRAACHPTHGAAFRFVAIMSASLTGLFAFALLLQAIAGMVLTGCER